MSNLSKIEELIDEQNELTEKIEELQKRIDEIETELKPLRTWEIRISSLDLAELILNNTDKIGSTEWDVYVDESGNVDIRHSTNPRNGWVEIIDLYSFWDNDETLNSTPEDLASWLESDGIPRFDSVGIGEGEAWETWEISYR